jgi:hypothetical protein
MNIENVFIMLYVLWHFNKYGTHKYLYYLCQKIYFFSKEYHKFWKPDHFIEDKKENEENYIVKPEPRPIVKYEDKYLEEIRKMNKEYEFTEEEKQMQVKKFEQMFDDLVKEKREKITECENKIKNICLKIKDFKDSDDALCLINDNEDDDMDFSLCLSKEDVLKKLEKELELVEQQCLEYKLILETEDGYDKLKKETKDSAYDFIVQEHLKRLKNCYIMENTPQGNVLLIYDLDRGSFKYYSDNTIPYRYLETVGRKYVKQFNCRPIFVDMEEELRLAQEKWDKERLEKERLEKEEKERRSKEESISSKKTVEKKNVFAKFKSYNKEAGTGKVSSAAPPKNSIPNQKISEKQENEKVLLKEKANRYTYEGKMANFSFIKKVDRKIVDKKYAMSFADFKKMQKEKK